MNFSNFKWLSYLKLRQFRFSFLLFLVLLGVSAFIGYQIPQNISLLYERYETRSLFIETIRDLFVLFVFQYITRLIYQVLLSRYIKKILGILRDELFEAWIYSHDFVDTKEKQIVSQDKYTRGEFQARLMNDTEAIRELITTGSLTIFIDFFFIFSCMVSFFEVHKFYGLSLIAAEGLICFFLILVSKVIRKVYAKVRKVSGNLSRVLSSLSSGFGQLYYTSHESYPLKVSLPRFDSFLKVQLKANLWDASYYSFVESLFPILLALVVVVFPYSEVTSVAILATIIDLIQRSIGPVKDIASKVSNIQRAMTGVSRMKELDGDLNETRVSELKGDLRIDVDSLQVRIDHYRYPDRKSNDFELNEINFELIKGKKLGIVGRSGCGKSTVLKLLSGQIFSDDIHLLLRGSSNDDNFRGAHLDDINKIRSNICLISQESYLFSQSLKFNITLESDPDENQFSEFWDETMRHIPYLKQWGIQPDDIISPAEVSAGQKQLISALRFCYFGKPVALFDEISSALDGELEMALSQFISYIEKRTMIVIVAHRLETIIGCDEILFLEKGSQKGRGSHSDLKTQLPEYSEFFKNLKQKSDLS